MSIRKYLHQMLPSSIFFRTVFMMGILICSHKSPAQFKQNTAKVTTPTTPTPISIEGLRQRTYKATLSFEKKLKGTEKYKADLYSYFSDSLKIYALVNSPETAVPQTGFPILIFGHGFHPEPKKYGISKETGENWRPGDYYRGIPEVYAEQGFIVITPDYRGHNRSEGYQYTKTNYLASSYYAIDVLHLIDALPALPNVDLENIFYMGHSMGGEVGLKMLLATQKVKAASIWCGVSSTVYEQAIYYGKQHIKYNSNLNPASLKKIMWSLDSLIQQLNFDYELSSGEPIHFIQDLNTPLIIHHSTRDTSVPYSWSESLVARLYSSGKDFEFYSYDSEHHLFKEENRKKAIERDIIFFLRR